MIGESCAHVLSKLFEIPTAEQYKDKQLERSYEVDSLRKVVVVVSPLRPMCGWLGLYVDWANLECVWRPYSRVSHQRVKCDLST